MSVVRLNLSCLLLLVAIAAGAAEAVEYSVAVIPAEPSAATTAAWAPFLESLSRETGLSFRLRTCEKTSDFEKDFEKGMPDLIFAHPIQTVSAHKAQGYVPLVRASRKIAAVIFVRSDSRLDSVKELQGEKIALVGSRSVCSIMVRQELANGQKLRFNYYYAGTVANVVRSVIDNQFAAGAALDTALEAESQDIRARLRVIGSTAAFAPHPLSAHPRVPQAARQAIVTAVLKMATSPEGRRMLRAVRLAEPMKTDYEADYMSLESIENKIVSLDE